MRTLITLLLCTTALIANAQAVLGPPAKTIKITKEKVNCILLSPRGDQLLIGTSDGADLIDIATGKRVHHFPFMEDQLPEVWHAQFNDNGEWLMLAGFTGKRQVWNSATGKMEDELGKVKWMPNSLAMKALGLKVGNSTYDRYYQQETATHGELKAKADKNGTVIFTDKNGAEVQRLLFPNNKDVHYRAPCVFTDTQFITGTDDGRVIIYGLR